MAAVLLRRRERRQLAFDFSVADTPAAQEIDRRWRNASEEEKKSRTIFAQRTVKPEDVMPEWEATRRLIGGFPESERFVSRALARLGAPLERLETAWKAPLDALRGSVRERLAGEGLVPEEGSGRALRLAFGPSPPAGAVSVHRAHPLTTVLAETFLAEALEPDDAKDDPASLPRCGAWAVEGIEGWTLVLLLRLRHRIEMRRRAPTLVTMAEEATALALARDGTRGLAGVDAAALLDRPSFDLPAAVRDRFLEETHKGLGGLQDAIAAFATERAQALAADHARVRRAGGGGGTVSVAPVLPPDVIGLYVLVPKV
jgi:hypothetical protein